MAAVAVAGLAAEERTKMSGIIRRSSPDGAVRRPRHRPMAISDSQRMGEGHDRCRKQSMLQAAGAFRAAVGKPVLSAKPILRCSLLNDDRRGNGCTHEAFQAGFNCLILIQYTADDLSRSLPYQQYDGGAFARHSASSLVGLPRERRLVPFRTRRGVRHVVRRSFQTLSDAA